MKEINNLFLKEKELSSINNTVDDYKRDFRKLLIKKWDLYNLLDVFGRYSKKYKFNKLGKYSFRKWWDRNNKEKTISFRKGMKEIFSYIIKSRNF